MEKIILNASLSVWKEGLGSEITNCPNAKNNRLKNKAAQMASLAYLYPYTSVKVSDTINERGNNNVPGDNINPKIDTNLASYQFDMDVIIANESISNHRYLNCRTVFVSIIFYHVNGDTFK